MTVACTTLTFALLLFARLELVRWVLAVVGAVVTAYYGYAIVRLLADGGAEFMALVLVAFLLWATATVLVLLPQTGRAMRGYQRRLAGPGGYGGYGGGGYGGGGYGGGGYGGGYGPPGGYRPY